MASVLDEVQRGHHEVRVRLEKGLEVFTQRVLLHHLHPAHGTLHHEERIADAVALDLSGNAVLAEIVGALEMVGDAGLIVLLITAGAV